MRHEHIGEAEIDYQLCRYGAAKMLFRGPRRSTRGDYVAFIGGTEFYGKNVEHPVPFLTEEEVRIPCVNLGSANASIDAFLRDPAIHEICQGSVLNVVQVMGAQNMSNRFYTVHPRRNDRFVKASSVMKAIYPDVDFEQFTFTQQMLATLYRHSPERFEIIQSELQMAWRARMKSFIGEIGTHTLLFWFAEHLPSDAQLEDRPDPMNMEPLFVTRSMVDELRPYVQSVVIAQPPSDARAIEVQNGRRNTLLDPLSQSAAATSLADAIKRLLRRK